LSIVFSAAELINTAIAIERRGVAFYDTMSRTARSDEEKEIFQLLAEMERHHIHVFQDMLGSGEEFNPSPQEAEEYAGYLSALVDSAVFSDDLATSEAVSCADSDMGALELAINSEKDSLLFYYEMRDIMPKSAHEIVDRVITEEKSHLRQLSALKSRLDTAENGQ
jgi:rubrerythrin